MNKVQEIHKSSLYGIIIETGCSTAFANKLYEEAGASNTIYYSLQPYSKDYEHARYGEFSRSVSSDFVKSVILKECDLNVGTNVNFVYSSSWQISDDKAITHGWVAIMTDPKFGMELLHFTFPKDSKITRKNAIDCIGDLGIYIVNACRENMHFDTRKFMEDFNLMNNMVILDEAYIYNLVTQDEVVDYELLLKVQENHMKDYPLVFGRDNTERFEELMRTSEEFIIQKGSFNPLHYQHIQMMINSKKLYPTAEPIFLISTYLYDKPHIDVKDLIDRIDNITKHGYKIIIFKEPLFYNTFKLLMNWAGKSKKFYFPMGSDTINRIYKNDFESDAKKHNHESLFSTKVFIEGMARIFSKQFKFIVHERLGNPYVEQVSWYGDLVRFVEDYKDDGISSTKIRNGEAVNRI